MFLFYMITWFERTRDFLSLIDPKESKVLVTLVEDFFDTALIIAKSNIEGKKQLLGSFIPYLGHLAAESTVTCALRQEALRTLNTLLDNTAREERKKLAASEEIYLLTKDLAKAILDVGDYDIQIAIVEALFRMMLKKWRNDFVHNWFEDQHIAMAFKEIKDRDFETDSRKFLNGLNESLGDKRRVCSIPCKAAHADMNQLKKPTDDKLEEFWIDFNFGSESITFYLDSPESALWESVRLLKEEISSHYLLEEGGEKILKVLMKNPTMINKKEVTKIKIHFDSHFDVSTPLFKIMGQAKIMIISEKVDDCGEDLLQQSAPVVTCHLESGKDTSNRDSLADILISQPSDQFATAAAETVTATDTVLTRENQHTEEHGTKASNDVAAVSPTSPSNALKSPPLNATTMSKTSPLIPKDNLIEPNMEGELDDQTRKTFPLQNDSLDVSKEPRNSNKQAAELEKNGYEFEHSSDSAAKELVSEMKQKMLVQKTSMHRNSETGDQEQSKSKRRLSSSYKAHLFSESNQETPSNGTSEKSWILDSQKSVPKTADYTRKRPRVRSNLKVLPLSSPSSGSDHRTKKMRNSSVHTEKAKRRMRPSLQIQDVTAQPFHISSTPLLTTGQRGLETVDDTLPLTDNLSLINSDGRVTKKYETSSRSLPLENKDVRFKRKLSDMSVNLDRKCPKLAEGESSEVISASIPFEPRKLFNSTQGEEVQKEYHFDNIENDVLVSQVPEEGIGEIGVVAAFENFTSELKKTFWSRYKRMEVITHSVLKAPEQNILTLLNQIHQSRLNELEHFHKTVIQELTDLEKRTQFLSNLEKDTLDTVYGLRAERNETPR